MDPENLGEVAPATAPIAPARNTHQLKLFDFMLTPEVEGLPEQVPSPDEELSE